VLGGDGIGPEVVAEALKVVRAAGVDLDTVDYDLGGARYLRDGTVLTDEIVEEWRGLDALLVGAVGTPAVPPGLIERGLLLRMRFELDLYINLRPFLYPENDIDMIVIRENT
jgi:3-isopropylmalate dehydrogenase